MVSTGTWVVIFAVGGDLDHLDPKRDTLANVDALGRAVPSARFMGGREFELLTNVFAVNQPLTFSEAVDATAAGGSTLTLGDNPARLTGTLNTELAGVNAGKKWGVEK